MSKRARKASASKVEERQRLLLDQLKEIAVNVGAEVREEKLSREVGYSVRSGPCRVYGQDVVLLDTNAALAERIEAMLDFLAGRDLEAVYMEPELREMIHGRAPKEPRGAQG